MSREIKYHNDFFYVQVKRIIKTEDNGDFMSQTLHGFFISIQTSTSTRYTHCFFFF